MQDIYLLERVQRRWTKHIDGMEGFSYGERLKALDLYSVQGRLLRADLIQYWKILNGHSCISASDLFQRPPHSRTRGHRNKVFPPIIATDLRKRCSRFVAFHCGTRCLPTLHVHLMSPTSSVLSTLACVTSCSATLINILLQPNELFMYLCIALLHVTCSQAIDA